MAVTTWKYNKLTDKKLLIFGGAGSLGQALVRAYREICSDIVVASRDEAKHWDLRNAFGVQHTFQRPLWGTEDLMKETSSQLKTVICDVRDARRVHQVIRDERPDYIIIAQALKQVDTCENQPSESIDTNILGVRNIIDAIEENNCHQSNPPSVCFVSTDKACNPINVYGMCKSISERMVAAVAKTSKSRYVITRYGNVMSTTGSIVPLFLKQAKSPDYKSFTVTDPRMTRFMMLLDESVSLIDVALNDGAEGDIWIPRLDAYNVLDLADYFSLKFGKSIKIVGMRPGEKIHEVLLSKEEDMRWRERGQRLVISDANPLRKEEPKEYSSSDHVISREELSQRLDTFLENGTYVKNVRSSGDLGS